MLRLWYQNAPWKLPFVSNTIFEIEPTTSQKLRSTKGTSLFIQANQMCQTKTGSIIDVPKLLSKEDKEKFIGVFPRFVQEITELPDMKEIQANQLLSRILHYNVPHGKLIRGLSTVFAYRCFASDFALDETNVELSYVLGWVVEMILAYMLILDDIIDHSHVRRGRPCWYRVDGVGVGRAINDAFLIQGALYSFLKKYFQDKEYYVDLLEIVRDVCYKTDYGQSLDTRTGWYKNIETFTMDLYSTIVKYKTSYLTCYFPVILAMVMAGVKDDNLIKEVEKVSFDMGHFYQVQDDFLDCYGDDRVIGNDIQESKCSWLIVTALERATPYQRQILLDNYGQDNEVKVKRVKDLYLEMQIPELYKTYEMQTFAKISSHIEEMPPQLPKILFKGMVDNMYRRLS